MKKVNLSVKKKNYNIFINKLKDAKLKKVYSEFKRNLEKEGQGLKKFSIAISGGPDSMALAYLAKTYSIQKKINFFYYIVDHKLRSQSSKEANHIKNILKKFGIYCKILTWKGKKVTSNIQSIARENRYSLIFKECEKKNINFIITAHHNDDLYENFFIRLVRGSGLKGLTSFSKTKAKINKKKDIYILRPLLNISKKDLLYVTKNTLNYWINDPSNNKDYFLRIKIRKLLNLLDSEGLSLDKFKLTLKNLYKSNLSIDYYVRQNIKKNSNQLNNKKLIIINETFFKHPDEIVFRSLSELVHIHGNKKNYPRGSKVSSLIENIKNINNFKKMTLSGCIFEKANKSIVITRES